MKLDPTNAALYTDSGRFLKFLRCPLQKSWDSLAPTLPGVKHCDSCARSVHNTALLSDEELERMIENDPHICLMISPRQNNCTILPRALQHHAKP